MIYKSILVQVDGSARTAVRCKIAAEIAARENAHLIGTSMTGISRFAYGPGKIDVNDSVVKSHLDGLRSHCRESLKVFEKAVSTANVTSFEARVLDDEAGDAICLQARYADLVIVAQHDPDEEYPHVAEDFPEYVVSNCGRPVLMVPYTGEFAHVGRRVLIAWDGSREASRAITGALPFLREADIVHLVVFNAEKTFDVHGALPGNDIALYLARHEVKVEVLRQTTPIDIGNAILSLAADMSSDLLVMGAYSHSRMREVLLGGVTRTVLRSMTVPVLMCH